MENIILDFFVQNWLILLLGFTNFLFFILFIRLGNVLGPFLGQSLRVSLGLVKDANLFVHFLNSKSAIIEWRSYKQVVKLDPEEVTSELVYVDRQNSYTPMTPRPKVGGMFSFLKKVPANEAINTIYTDDFVPVQLDSTKNFWVFGKQMHVIYEGQNMTMNPLANFTQDAQVKKAGIAVEHQLMANKLLVESEFRNKIATKDDIRNWSLLQLVVLGLGVGALIIMVIGMQGALGEFTKFVTTTFETYRPALENFIRDIPRVVEG